MAATREPPTMVTSAVRRGSAPIVQCEYPKGEGPMDASVDTEPPCEYRLGGPNT